MVTVTGSQLTMFDFFLYIPSSFGFMSLMRVTWSNFDNVPSYLVHSMNHQCTITNVKIIIFQLEPRGVT